MKKSALQFTRQMVEAIKHYIDGNVAEHLISDAKNEECGFHYYMSNNEAEEYDRASSQRRAEMENQIIDFINTNFNFDISEFEY